MMLCRFFRFTISSAADSGRPVGPVTSRHIARCDGCRQFVQSCQQLAEGLRSEAAGWQHEVEHLRGRAASDCVRLEAANHGSGLRVALAAAACVAVAAAVTLFLIPSANRPETHAVPAGVVIPAGTQWTTRCVELIQTPLAVEAENLTSDAESGIRFLAACLDVRPLGADVTTHPGDDGLSPLR